MDSVRLRMSGLTPFARKHKVTVVGSGNWGSTISKVVAENTAAHPELFEKDVQMWVYEENVQLPKDSKHYDASSELCTGPQKLTQLINHFHENVKYLPGIPLPHNVIANPSITDSVKDSSILIFNLPHQFIEGLCKQLRGHILPYARGISCIKGVSVKGSSISLFSESIGQELDIYCGALSGANIANEVAQEKFSETTIAYDAPQIDSQNPTPATSTGPSPSSSQVDLTKITQHKDVSGRISKVKLRPLPSEYHPIDHHTFKALFHRPYFHVRVVSDVAGVSLGGALKNIVAVAAGWVEGLGWGDNAKAAIMRVGLLEMVDFGKRFFPTVHSATFTVESAGVADLITTCAGGRHRRCAMMSVQEGKTIEEIEKRELNGQSLQGTSTAIEVNEFLKSQGLEKDFPLFTAVHDILKGKKKPHELPDLIEKADESMPQSPSRTSQPAHALDTSNVISINPSTTPAEDEPPPTNTQNIFIPAPPLASPRYARQLLLPRISLPGQSLLSRSRILLIGLGGLGSPASLYLAGAGISTLGLLDSDVVELSNLHRQILHRSSSATTSMSKVTSAIRTLRDLNDEINYIPHETRLTPSNAVEIIRGYDVVLDCTDNPSTRYLISDVCVLLGKPLVSGAAQRADGQLMVLHYPVTKGPCYRCIFPVPPAPETVRSCSEIGILGPVVGVVGTLMATEAIKVVLGMNQNQDGKAGMLLYDAFAGDLRSMWRGLGLRGKRKGCVACGQQADVSEAGMEKITLEGIQSGRMDYEGFCGRVEQVRVLDGEQRVNAKEFMSVADDSEGRIVVDVREEVEYTLGPKIRDSINIPISRILRSSTTQGGSSANHWEDLLDQKQKEGKPIYFVCQQGNDSQIAAKRLLGKEGRGSKRWIGDIAGGFVALQTVADRQNR